MSCHDTSTWEFLDDRLAPRMVWQGVSLFRVGTGHLGTLGGFEVGLEREESAAAIDGLFATTREPTKVTRGQNGSISVYGDLAECFRPRAWTRTKKGRGRERPIDNVLPVSKDSATVYERIAE